MTSSKKVLTGFTALALLILMVSSILLPQFLPQDTQASASPLPTPEPLCKDCHIILVSLDTCSANHMQCYGYERETMPNLCHFGQENIFFQNAYSTSHWTLPSHVSLFTGQLPSVHQVNHVSSNVFVKPDKLSQTTPFLPEILQKAGYETLFYMPAGDQTLPIHNVYNRGITRVDTDGYSDNSETYIAKALQSLRENNQKGQKTFLFFHTYKCHDPYVIDDEPKIFTTDNFPEIPTKEIQFNWLTNFDFQDYVIEQLGHHLEDLTTVSMTQEQQHQYDKYQEMYRRLTAEQDRSKRALIFKEYFKDTSLTLIGDYSYKYFVNQHFDVRDQRKTEYLRALYDQELSQLDRRLIPELTAIASDPTLKDKTVIIITSDHGEEFGEHGFIGHTTLYDQNLHVPFIMSIPNIKRVKVADQVSGVDVMPTILDIVGLPPQHHLNGISIIPTLQGQQLPSRLVISEYISDEMHKKVLRKGDWKLFVSMQQERLIPYELYNIKDDPDELNNILNSNLDISQQILQDYTQQSRLMMN